MEKKATAKQSTTKTKTDKPVLAWLAMAGGFIMFLVFMFPQLWSPVTPGLAGLRLAVLLIGLAVFAAGLASYNRWSLESRKSLVRDRPSHRISQSTSQSPRAYQADDEYESFSPGGQDIAPKVNPPRHPVEGRDDHP